jgi:nicotinate-nucleotide adenylyltransferase
VRFGVFGGSFNPPHVGHLAVAEAAADAARLDRVLWIPAATPPHKRDDPTLASAADRLAMVRLATAGNDRFEVSDVEIAREGVSYTVDTLRALSAERPDARWSLILGGDSFTAFPTWRDPAGILSIARLLVYARPGASPAIPPDLAPHVDVVDGPALDLSSTELRARIGAGRSVRYLVPDAVRAYIDDRALYRPAT